MLLFIIRRDKQFLETVHDAQYPEWTDSLHKARHFDQHAVTQAFELAALYDAEVCSHDLNTDELQILGAPRDIQAALTKGTTLYLCQRRDKPGTYHKRLLSPGVGHSSTAGYLTTTELSEAYLTSDREEVEELAQLYPELSVCVVEVSAPRFLDAGSNKGSIGRMNLS